MGAFEIKHPYDLSTYASDSEDSESAIDSDISNDDLRNLREELQAFDPETVQRPLADVTIALQEATKRQWTRLVTLVALCFYRLLSRFWNIGSVRGFEKILTKLCESVIPKPSRHSSCGIAESTFEVEGWNLIKRIGSF